MKVKIFLSYAYRDTALADRLRAHLLPLERQGLAEVLMDTAIAPGGEWGTTVNNYLNIADIILLLVSPDFLNSDYCYSTEMMSALERHKEGKARVIPIILRPVHWQNAPFGNLQPLPTDAKPVTKWNNLDSALVEVVRHIYKATLEVPNAKPPASLSMNAMPEKPLSRRSVLLIGLGGVTVIASVTAGLISSHNYIPKEPPGPAITPSPGSVVYQANWSQGMDGWTNPSGDLLTTSLWQPDGGVLRCNGKIISDRSQLIIVAPFVPQTPNYAAEAQIQFVDIVSHVNPASFGMIVRYPTNNPATPGYFAGMGGGDTTLNKIVFEAYNNLSSTEKFEGNYNPDQSWHTYRLEAKNNKITFLIDNHLVFEEQNTSFPGSGFAGLTSVGCILNVRNFKIIEL